MGTAIYCSALKVFVAAGEFILDSSLQALEHAMKKSLMMFALICTMSSVGQAATTEQRYAQACAACHASGVMNAPKKGDKAAWAPRLKQGEATLVTHVKKGYKMMPPMGLCNDCTDAEFKALIKFMSK